MKNVTILILSLFLSPLYAQDFAEGYKMLDSQNYTEALQYFTHQKSTYPDNITAKICYGRALGLSGSAEAALDFFSTLAREEPSNDEVEINLAESLLWNKKYIEAREKYEKLYQKHPDKKFLRTKYAESLSQTQEHDKALLHIDTVVHDHSDSTALVSHKYLYLAAAYDYVKKNDTRKARALLDHALEHHTDDGDVLMSMADIALQEKKTQEAMRLYKTAEKIESDPYRAKRGQALAYYQSMQYERATYITHALLTQRALVQDTLLLIDIYLAQNKRDEALKIHTATSPNQHMAALQIAQYKSDYESADGLLRQLKSGPTSIIKSLEQGIYFYHKKTQDSLLQAYRELQGEDDAYLNQRAIQIRQTANFADLKYAYGLDSDSGQSHKYTLSTRLRMSPSWYLYPRISQKNTLALRGDSSAQMSQLGVGISRQKHSNLEVHGYLGFIKIASLEGTIPVYDLGLRYRPLPNHYMSLGINKELQDFNTALISQQLGVHSLTAAYNYTWHQRIGWYTHTRYSLWDDHNRQLSFYNSLYLRLKRKPGIKTGINLQYMSFRDAKSSLYFSPNSYLLTEVFIELHKDLTESGSFFYHVLGSVGYQKIEDQKRQSSYRIESSLGYKFWKENHLSLFGGYSNAANTSVSGFAYTTVGVQARVYF